MPGVVLATVRVPGGPNTQVLRDTSDAGACFHFGWYAERSPTVHVAGAPPPQFLPLLRRARLSARGAGVFLQADDLAYDTRTRGVELVRSQGLELGPLGTWLHGSVQVYAARDPDGLHLVARGVDVAGEIRASFTDGTTHRAVLCELYTHLSARASVELDIPAVVPHSESEDPLHGCRREERIWRVRVTSGAHIETSAGWFGPPHTELNPGGTSGEPCPRNVASSP